MPVTYPESWWTYMVNAATYWPYRDNQVSEDPDMVIPYGEHRYFRYNTSEENTDSIVRKAGAAGVWVKNISCYSAGEGQKFCEGYVEPRYLGVTLGHLSKWLKATAMEISEHPSGFVEEAIQDLDDYLTMDFYTVHPVRFASWDDTLHPNSYYPVSAWYTGQRPGTYTKAPPPESIAAKLRENGMGFYQPNRAAGIESVAFILMTGDQPTTPRELADLLQADAVLANLNTLNPTAQDLLKGNYTGEGLPQKIVRFYSNVGEEADDVAEKAIEILKYTAWGAAVLGTAWLGLKLYPHFKEAYEGAKGK